VPGEQERELWCERDLAHGRGRLRRHPLCGPIGLCARELATHVDQTGGEVDVGPAEAEQLGESDAGVGGARKQGPVAGRAGGEQAREFAAGQRALAGGERAWTLARLEPA